MTGQHPPRPRLTLNVGITGHRRAAIPQEILETLGQKLHEVFGFLQAGIATLEEKQAPFYEHGPSVMRLHTALASGADQMAAGSARVNGFEVRALLPFATNEYGKDFARGDERDQYRHLLQESDEIFCLPGSRDREEDAYLTVGKAIIAAADVIVAVWDGGEGNGPGGTAHVVDLSLRAGVPVIHIPINRKDCRVEALRLLTGGDIVETEFVSSVGEREITALIDQLLTPRTAIERGQLLEYFEERERTVNWRIEYPLLLSLLGIKKLSPKPWRQTPLSSELKYGPGNSGGEAIDNGGDPRELAYAWANFLAIRYAQLFRSGHVTNYFLSAFAVLIALLGLILPSVKVYLVAVELATIGLLYVNTSAGRSGDWHRRWLQYRRLAESLRLLEYLKQTGLAGPPFRNEYALRSFDDGFNVDWTGWYCAAIWREMNSPTGLMSTERTKTLAQSVASDQIASQASYHLVNAERMHALDHRLHEFGSFLMGAVIASCCLYIFVYWYSPDLARFLTSPFIFITAGFPALGAAVFGLRGHGEHLLTASRSIKTSRELTADVERLEAVEDPEELANLLVTITQVMLSDLALWTVSYSEKSLEVPA